MTSKTREVLETALLAVVTMALIMMVVMTLNPVLASTSGNVTNSTTTTNSTISTNSTTISNVTVTNVTCPPGLLTAISANLYIDDMWLTRVGVNISGYNLTSYGNVTGLNMTTMNGTMTGFNITVINGTYITPMGLNLTPALLQNITNYYVSKGECLLALQFLVHLRHLIVHEFVMEKHAEILNMTLTYRLRLLNSTLTRLEEQGLINSTEASEIYGIMSELEKAIVSGNYTYASELLKEYESLISNITATYNMTQARGFTNRVNHELDHFVMQIIKKSQSLNETLTQLGLLTHELNMLGNITGLNITKIQELHEIFKELEALYPMVHGNKTLEAQLLQLLRQGKGIDDLFNKVNQFNSQLQVSMHGKGSMHGHGNGKEHGNSNGKGKVEVGRNEVVEKGKN